MGILKSFVAYIIGYVVLLLMYQFVAIPVFPILSIYAAGMLLLSDKGLKLRRVLVFLLGCTALFIYGNQVYNEIIYYPDYGNVLAIIFEFITIFAFIGTTAQMLVMLTVEIRNQREVKIIEQLSDIN